MSELIPDSKKEQDAVMQAYRDDSIIAAPRINGDVTFADEVDVDLDDEGDTSAADPTFTAIFGDRLVKIDPVLIITLTMSDADMFKIPANDRDVLQQLNLYSPFAADTKQNREKGVGPGFARATLLGVLEFMSEISNSNFIVSGDIDVQKIFESFRHNIRMSMPALPEELKDSIDTRFMNTFVWCKESIGQGMDTLSIFVNIKVAVPSIMRAKDAVVAFDKTVKQIQNIVAKQGEGMKEIYLLAVFNPADMTKPGINALINSLIPQELDTEGKNDDLQFALASASEIESDTFALISPALGCAQNTVTGVTAVGNELEISHTDSAVFLENSGDMVFFTSLSEPATENSGTE